MSLSNRIRPGEPLDADEVEQNFQDLDTLISAMDEEQIERGAINTRHAESANDWKTLETKTEAAGVPLGVAQALVPLVPSNFTTYTGEAYLVRGMVTAQSTGDSSPWSRRTSRPTRARRIWSEGWSRRSPRG